MNSITKLSTRITCSLLALAVLLGFNGTLCLVHCAILRCLAQNIPSPSKQTLGNTDQYQNKDFKSHNCCTNKNRPKSSNKRYTRELESRSLLANRLESFCRCSKGVSVEPPFIPNSHISVANTIRPASTNLLIPVGKTSYNPDKRPDRLPDQSRTFLQCSVILI